MSDAWESLMVRLHHERGARLLAYATMLAGVRDAEDLVQDAVIATFSRRRGLKSLPEAEAYVRRAIATTYIDHVRADSARRRRERVTAVPELLTDPAPLSHSKIDLQAALEGISPRHRACVVLRYLDDLSVSDTAAVVGISEGAVKRYVHDGLQALNVVLGTHWEDVDVTGVQVTALKGDLR